MSASTAASAYASDCNVQSLARQKTFFSDTLAASSEVHASVRRDLSQVSKSQKRPSKCQKRPVKYQKRPRKCQKRPIKCQKRPSKYQKRPISSVKSLLQETQQVSKETYLKCVKSLLRGKQVSKETYYGANGTYTPMKQTNVSYGHCS
jgi:hypothetical protein